MEKIDLNDEASCKRWMQKLNITHQQMSEAVQAVGTDPSDVEMHLKGVRSTSNDENMEKEGSGPRDGKPSAQP